MQVYIYIYIYTYAHNCTHLFVCSSRAKWYPVRQGPTSRGGTRNADEFPDSSGQIQLLTSYDNIV